MAVLAFGHSWISSRKIKDFFGTSLVCKKADKFAMMVFASKSPSKICEALGLVKKLIS